MNPDWLLKHFEQISEAPEAVPRLRRFILDLAVRGMLVEQDPADEPAAELLKRNTFKKESQAKRQSSLPKIGPSEMRIVLPQGWTVERLGNLASKITDGAHKTPTYVESGIPFVSVKDFSSGRLDFSNTRFISESEHKVLYQRCDPRRGDILIGRIGTLGKAVIVDTDDEFSLFVSVGLIRLDPETLVAEFLRIQINSPFIETQFDEIKIGGATHTNKLNLRDLSLIQVSLPPLAEQHRIVAKVDELMALCDELEATQAKREKRRDRLVAASLNGLNNSASGEEFRENARFCFNHLPRLTTRPEHIHQLRQTILNLAVCGKLVPQDPADEPASDLLRRIQDERRRVMKKGEIKKQKVLPAIADVLFDVPRSWSWARIQDLAANEPNSITDGPFGSNLKTEHYIPTPGYRVVRLQNIGIGTFIEHHRSYISKDRFERLSKHHVRPGDLVVAGLADPVARCCHVPSNIGPALVKADTYRLKLHPMVNSRYVSHFLNSEHCKSHVESFHHGMTRVRINLQNFKALIVPLPPLVEQHRIVAKVDELMALCDELEARVVATATTRHQLLKATLYEALSGRSGRLPEYLRLRGLADENGGHQGDSTSSLEAPRV